MKYFVLLLFFLSFFLTFAQESYEIDLGKNQGEVIRKTMNHSKDIALLIKNKLPNTIYDVSITREFQLNDELQLEKGKSDSQMEKFSFGCTEITALIEKIDLSKTEKDLAEYVKDLEKLLVKLEKNTSGAPECSAEQIVLAKEKIEETREIRLVEPLKRNERIVITISRQKSDGKKIEWKHILEGAKKGKWLTTYGFSFIPESLKKSEAYFLQQNDTTFTITELNRRSRLNFAPSIFFTWFPYKRVDNDFALTFTGGLGYDFEAPTVFVGGSLLYNQNIGISFGLAGHQQEFLNGRYSEGDVLLENLADESLNEKLYSINPFISVTFRLGQAPFKSKNSVDSSENN